MTGVPSANVSARFAAVIGGACWLILLANQLAPAQARRQAEASHLQVEDAGQSKGCASFQAHAIPDSELVDQDNRRVHFRTDLVAGRTVAINFVYTSCETTCPLMGATFGKLQRLLGDRLEKDVRLISISVDPVTDTPERLREWAAQFHAKPGWTLVTGQKVEVDDLLQALGEAGTRGQNHSVLVLVVNHSGNLWARVNGIGSSQDLAECVLSMADTR